MAAAFCVSSHIRVESCGTVATGCQVPPSEARFRSSAPQSTPDASTYAIPPSKPSGAAYWHEDGGSVTTVLVELEHPATATAKMTATAMPFTAAPLPAAHDRTGDDQADTDDQADDASGPDEVDLRARVVRGGLHQHRPARGM